MELYNRAQNEEVDDESEEKGGQEELREAEAELGNSCYEVKGDSRSGLDTSVRRRRSSEECVGLLECDVDALDLDVVEDVARSAEEDAQDVEGVVDYVVEDDLASHRASTDWGGDEGEEGAEGE